MRRRSGAGEYLNRRWSEWFARRSGAMWIVVVYVTIGVISGASLSGPQGKSRSHLGAHQKDSQRDALKRLERVFFGNKSHPVHRHHRSPPQVMVELYKSVAYSDGITRTPNPYDADVIRGFPDRASRHKMHFFFNTSYMESTETVLQAELRIFQLRPRPYQTPRHGHLIELNLYRVTNNNQVFTLSGAELLETRRVSGHAHGWHVFKVTQVIQGWVEHPESNKGFLVTAQSLRGDHVNGTWVRFAQRSEHHDSKQPVLVVFTQDNASQPTYIEPSESDLLVDQKAAEKRLSSGKSKRPKMDLSFLNEGPHQNNPVQKRRRVYVDPKMHEQIRQLNEQHGRSKRSTNGYQARKRRKWCSRRQMYVNFDQIGWSGWIISPKGYHAYHCKGECPFPLGQHQKPTNHATVQSIIHALGVAKDVSTPCCVPNKLYSISLLYFDDDDNVILKQYDDMVAASCGCH